MEKRRSLLALVGGMLVAIIAAACFGGDGAETPTATSSPPAEGTEEPQAPVEDIPSVARSWKTNWAKRSIDLGELTVGIPVDNPRDRIPPLDSPAFETVEQADGWLEDREPGVLFQLGGDVRFYPLRILTWHEIVNDEVGGRPVVITFCPLCNTAIAFERAVDGQVLRFGTSGLLRFSDLVMWDDVTESLWQQLDGSAIVGDMVGKRLSFLPASIIPWSEFKAQFPGGKVLSQDTGFRRNYGSNPYLGYSSTSKPFLFNGELDDRFPAMERVVGVIVNGQDKAYPFSVISREGAVNDEVAGVPIAVFWGAADTADALDTASIPQGQAIGVGVAYERRLNGQILSFRAQENGNFLDNETGSTWNILGLATAGPLAGSQLAPVVHTNHFWFAWAAFNPEDPVYTGGS